MIFGGGKRDRTADPLNAIQVLSQLSYTPDYYNQIINFGVFALTCQFKEGAILKRGRAIVNDFLTKHACFLQFFGQ